MEYERRRDVMDATRAYNFWRDGCATMVRNIKEVLVLAGQEPTIANILLFVRSLPKRPCDLLDEKGWQRGYCGACLERVFGLPRRRGEEVRFRELIDYFVVYFVDLTDCAQYMLVESFIGILGALEGR
jgi:hypothetical protein